VPRIRGIPELIVVASAARGESALRDDTLLDTRFPEHTCLLPRISGRETSSAKDRLRDHAERAVSNAGTTD